MFFEDEEEKIKVIKEITKFFGNLTEFTAHDINREISYFVYRKYEKDKKMGNVNIYKILKFVITGDSNVNDLGEICQFIGKKESMARLKSAVNFSIGKAAQNNKLFEDKRTNKLALVSQLELSKIKLIEDVKSISNENKKFNKIDIDKDFKENLERNENKNLKDNDNDNENVGRKRIFNKSLSFNKNVDI